MSELMTANASVRFGYDGAAEQETDASATLTVKTPRVRDSRHSRQRKQMIAVARAKLRNATTNRQMCHPYFKPAIQKLEEFKVLSPNWDSYGAERITDTAIMTAKRLLLALQDRLENELDFERPWLDLSRTSPSPLTPYWVVPLPSGGVQMEWQGPESEIEVEIDGVGNLGYLRIVRMEPNVQSFQEEEQATLPNIIHHILETLSVDV